MMINGRGKTYLLGQTSPVLFVCSYKFKMVKTPQDCFVMQWCPEQDGPAFENNWGFGAQPPPTESITWGSPRRSLFLNDFITFRTKWERPHKQRTERAWQWKNCHFPWLMVWIYNLLSTSLVTVSLYLARATNYLKHTSNLLLIINKKLVNSPDDCQNQLLRIRLTSLLLSKAAV